MFNLIVVTTLTVGYLGLVRYPSLHESTKTRLVGAGILGLGAVLFLLLLRVL